MTTRPTKPRAGVTLIELLVVMAIITALGLLALMLIPGINNTDGALKGTEEVRAQVKIAQALAGASRQPRGVRFLIGGNAANPTAATELQLLESPPVSAIDPLALQSGRTGNADGVSGPFVELVYELVSGSAVPSGQVAGGIRTRHCYIYLPDVVQRAQAQEAGALLYMPTLGAWSRVKGPIGAAPAPPAYPNGTVEVELDVYPDAVMGAATHYRTYHAGIYGTPIPLLGTPTIPLPKDIGVDLEASSPNIRQIQQPVVREDVAFVATTTTVPYDVMFAPDGQTVMVGRRLSSAGVYLWVRDVTKIVNPFPGAGAFNPNSMKYTLGTEFTANVPNHRYYEGFRIGGEHHAVGINNGAVGTAPVQWPGTDGTYPANSGGPFGFVRRKTN